MSALDASDTTVDVEARLAHVEQLLADGEAAAAQLEVAAVLQQHPEAHRAYYLAGRIERLAGHAESAMKLLRHAAELGPAHVETHLELAALLRRGREFDKSMDELGIALYHDPENAQAYFELGNIHRLQGDLDGAESFFRKAIEKDPALGQAYTELGWICLTRERYDEAIEMLEKTIELDPGSLVGHNNLGFAYVKTEQYDRAMRLFADLSSRMPRNMLWPKINLGNAYEHTGQFDKAEQICDEILMHEPNNFSAHWNRAHNLLSRQDFERGWSEYEYRFQVEGIWRPRLIPFAPWQGEPLAGKTIMVIAEQGLGDQIMFSSCLPQLAAQAGRVILECEHRLAPLMQRSFPEVQVIGSRHELKPPWLRDVGEVDYQVSICSLPSFFRRKLEDFPKHHGYLAADPQKVERWRTELAKLGPGLKVGISWRGGTTSTRRSLRSIALRDLTQILQVPGCRFVSLQYGKCVEEIQQARSEGLELEHWQEAIDDYGETAALCTALGLTVSVCTAVIHLNGALGRPVWVMVPSVPEWRYGREGESMPWYPSVRLFRQRSSNDWDDVFSAVARALAVRASA